MFERNETRHAADGSVGVKQEPDCFEMATDDEEDRKALPDGCLSSKYTSIKIESPEYGYSTEGEDDDSTRVSCNLKSRCTHGALADVHSYSDSLKSPQANRLSTPAANSTCYSLAGAMPKSEGSIGDLYHNLEGGNVCERGVKTSGLNQEDYDEIYRRAGVDRKFNASLSDTSCVDRHSSDVCSNHMKEYNVANSAVTANCQAAGGSGLKEGGEIGMFGDLDRSEFNATRDDHAAVCGTKCGIMSHVDDAQDTNVDHFGSVSSGSDVNILLSGGDINHSTKNNHSMGSSVVPDSIEYAGSVTYSKRPVAVENAVALARTLASMEEGKLVPIDREWKTDGKWKDILHRRPNKFPYHRGKLQQQMWKVYGITKKWIPSPFADEELYDKRSIGERAIALLNYSSSSDSSDDECK